MKKVKHIFLNYSTYDSYMTCPRKMAFQSVENLSPSNSMDESLSARWKGMLIHKCIDAAYSGKNWEDIFDSELSKVEFVHKIDALKSGGVGHLRNLLVSYMEHYNVPNDPEYEITATERRLEMPINSWLTLVGMVDKIAINKVDNKLSIIDHKTSSSLASFLVPTIPVSDQFTAYIALAQANGHQTETLVVDGISTALKALKTNEGLFIRYSTGRNTLQIAEFIKRFEFVATRMKEDIENCSFTTRQGKACFDFNSRCQFYDACVLSGQGRIDVLRNNFRKQLDENPSFRIIYT